MLCHRAGRLGGGIQTTRLLLFEFFVRFLTGAGREFKPLLPPVITRSAISEPNLRGQA